MGRRRKQAEAPLLDGVGEAEVAEVVVAPPVEAEPVRKWRVVHTVKVSLDGRLMTMCAGKIVSVAGYGEAAIEALKQQAELEPVR